MKSGKKTFDDLRHEFISIAKPAADDVREQAPKLSKELQHEFERIMHDTSKDAKKYAPKYRDAVMSGLLAMSPLVAKSAIRPAWYGVFPLVAGIAAGAAIMYFLDPDRGESRRQWGRAQVMSSVEEARQWVAKDMTETERAEFPSGRKPGDEAYG